jgi:predicted transglutaminase-like protease
MNSEHIRKNINVALNAAVVSTINGETRALVCLVCDRFIHPKNLQTLSLKQLKNHHSKLKPIKNSNLSENVINCYRVLSPVDMTDEDFFEIDTCLLSPRAT